MHTLLSIGKRLARLRRRRDEIDVWRHRCSLRIDGWTFDGAPIRWLEPWPDITGVHRFVSPIFDVPDEWPLEEVRLALELLGESLLHIRYGEGREITVGLDVNHTLFHLEERRAQAVIEAVAKGPFGTNSSDPRLWQTELVWLETGVVELSMTLALIADAAEHLDGHDVQSLLLDLGESALARLAWPTLTDTVLSRKSRFAARWGEREFDGRQFETAPLDEAARNSVADANAWLKNELASLQRRYPQQGAVALVGHAHLDTAWLWTIEETRRKVQRTFSTVVNLIGRHPEFRFVQSFAEYYRGLEDENPELLAAVRGKVASGEWEPIGGFWVEPDINMPCGESLVRQALYGQRYFEKTLGKRHAVAWLPDTFGFSPALPQILRGAGLESLFTIKIGWSETNKFPHTRFWWEGIDGSRVLVQQTNTPEDTYNGLVDPSSLLRVWRNHADKLVGHEALQPIGFGDGGGGPTEEMIEAYECLKNFPAIPKARFASIESYFAEAHTEARSQPPETWVGELYLEYHRGTLTTQGRTKYLHRRAERDLIAAEAMGAFAWIAGGERPGSLQDHWRLLMINQFHDILPGSSIGEVYRRTERELREVSLAANELSEGALEHLAASYGKGAGKDGLLVVNPDLQPRKLRIASDEPLPGGQKAEEGYVQCSDEIVSALSMRVGPIARGESEAHATPRSLENDLIRLDFADDGSILRALDKRAGRDILDGRGNQIWAWRDQPREYDAWDIDEDYRRAGEEITADGEIEVIETGPDRCALRIVRKFRASTIVQSVRLWANSARVDFHTRFNWHDRRVLVKAHFPLRIRSDFATFECAFGVYRRPTHRNTSWDAARFEVAAHRFVDLSEHGYGVALLNDGRYGHHAMGSELGISLLRSPTLPDRFADEGEQHVTYALYPHAGDWFSGGVLAEAEDLNRPLFCRAVGKGKLSTRAFLKVRGISCALGALKPAEDGDGLILRVYEPAGARGPIEIEPPDGWSLAGEVSLLEDPVSDPPGTIRPFEIRSFRLRPPRR